jgi:hypothetical protein
MDPEEMAVEEELLEEPLGDDDSGNAPDDVYMSGAL